MSFGEMVKNLRIAQQKTLRQFCTEHGLDPSNWSKIERAINAPPRDEGTLIKWARYLGLAPESDGWKDFMDQAEISRGNLPKDVLSDEKLLSKLPVFLRTVRGADLTEAQLDDFINKVREAHTPGREYLAGTLDRFAKQYYKSDMSRKKLRIYLDTSVINFMYADDAPEKRDATIEFFVEQSHGCELFVSRIVLAEIARDPDSSHRAKLVAVLDKYPVVVLPPDRNDEVEELARAYIAAGVIPAGKAEDAMHVAYATVHEMDVLLSWNFKHLANVRREARVVAVNIQEGYRHPLRMVSPPEVEDENEDG